MEPQAPPQKSLLSCLLDISNAVAHGGLDGLMMIHTFPSFVRNNFRDLNPGEHRWLPTTKREEGVYSIVQTATVVAQIIGYGIVAGIEPALLAIPISTNALSASYEKGKEAAQRDGTPWKACYGRFAESVADEFP